MEDNEEEQYQKKLRRRVSEALKAAQIEEQKKEMIKQFLDDKAYERLMNIRLSNRELYNQLINLVVSLAQSNRVTGRITDTQLKSILEKMTYRHEPKIEFKHK
ncbi:MAG: DNA-binding protein [Candidatus Micrarchaeaceae archaeon]